MFTIVILSCIQKIKQERSLSSIYHLLKGKRSSQTLQDAHIYHLTHYFGIYKSIDRSNYLNYVEQLKDEGYITTYGDDFASLSEKGHILLESNREQGQDISCLNGLQYEKIASVFEQRLLLFIQTITNIESGNQSFVAVCDDQDIQGWVKRLYRFNKDKRKLWLEALYKELHPFLTNLSHLQSSIFVDRLTGYNRFGLSKEQLVQKYHLSKHDVSIFITLLNHKLVTYVRKDSSQTPFLIQFLDGYVDQQFITNSAMHTLELYNKGYTLEQIQYLRNLKESTIQDHFVEIAYSDPSFDIEVFVTKDAMDEIELAVSNINSRKLKTIKQYLRDKYSYFQIRLVLAARQTVREKGIELP